MIMILPLQSAVPLANRHCHLSLCSAHHTHLGLWNALCTHGLTARKCTAQNAPHTYGFTKCTLHIWVDKMRVQVRACKDSHKAYPCTYMFWDVLIVFFHVVTVTSRRKIVLWHRQTNNHTHLLALRHLCVLCVLCVGGLFSVIGGPCKRYAVTAVTPTRMPSHNCLPGPHSAASARGAAMWQNARFRGRINLMTQNPALGTRGRCYIFRCYMRVAVHARFPVARPGVDITMRRAAWSRHSVLKILICFCSRAVHGSGRVWYGF